MVRCLRPFSHVSTRGSAAARGGHATLSPSSCGLKPFRCDLPCSAHPTGVRSVSVCGGCPRGRWAWPSLLCVRSARAGPRPPLSWPGCARKWLQTSGWLEGAALRGLGEVRRAHSSAGVEGWSARVQPVDAAPSSRSSPGPGPRSPFAGALPPRVQHSAARRAASWLQVTSVRPCPWRRRARLGVGAARCSAGDRRISAVCR